MKSFLRLSVKAPYVLELTLVPIRHLKAKEILVKTLLSGISHGTELAILQGTTPTFSKEWREDYQIYINGGKPSKSYPTVLGYESVGEIIEVGSGVNNFMAGDIVWVDSPHQEYSILHVERHQIYKLPNKSFIRRAIFLALTRVALAGIHDARIKIGDRVAVFGLGTVGLITTQLAQLASSEDCFGIDPIEMRRKTARKFLKYCFDPSKEDVGEKIHETMNGGGVDVAIETSGSPEALHQAIRSCKKGGRVVTVGTYRQGAAEVFLGEEWHRNRIELISSMSVNGCVSRDYPLWTLDRLNNTALQLLVGNKIEVESFITHVYPFRQATKAYQYLMEHPENTIKIALDYTSR